MRGKSKLTLEQKNQRFKALLGDENIPNLENLTKDQFSKLVKEHRAAGVKLLPAPAREGLSDLEAPQFTTDIFSRKLGTAGEKISENLSTLLGCI